MSTTWTPPSNSLRQKDEPLSKEDDGVITKTFSWKGPLSDLVTCANNTEPGTVILTNWIALSWRISNIPGGWGELNITCKPKDFTGEGTEVSPIVKTPIKERWSVHTVRNDVSILGYCGSESDCTPSRGLIEAWMKEPDGELAKENKFKCSDGNIYEIDERDTLAVMDKIKRGIESVIRCYPVLTCVKTYSSTPPKCMENVSFIDTPSPSTMNYSKSPDGLSQCIQLHQWLKVQDDIDEQTDGTWTRTESWMGILYTDSLQGVGPWDPDLYSTNRWSMPLMDYSPPNAGN